MYLGIPKISSAMSRSFPGNVLDISGEIPGNVKKIRSHGNSRGANSREVRRFLGHNSWPRKFWEAPPGGNSSYRPPGAFSTRQGPPRTQEILKF